MASSQRALIAGIFHERRREALRALVTGGPAGGRRRSPRRPCCFGRDRGKGCFRAQVRGSHVGNRCAAAQTRPRRRLLAQQVRKCGESAFSPAVRCSLSTCRVPLEEQFGEARDGSILPAFVSAARSPSICGSPWSYSGLEEPTAGLLARRWLNKISVARTSARALSLACLVGSLQLRRNSTVFRRALPTCLRSRLLPQLQPARGFDAAADVSGATAAGTQRGGRTAVSCCLPARHLARCRRLPQHQGPPRPWSRTYALVPRADGAAGSTLDAALFRPGRYDRYTYLRSRRLLPSVTRGRGASHRRRGHQPAHAFACCCARSECTKDELCPSP